MHCGCALYTASAVTCHSPVCVTVSTSNLLVNPSCADPHRAVQYRRDGKRSIRNGWPSLNYARIRTYVGNVETLQRPWGAANCRSRWTSRSRHDLGWPHKRKWCSHLLHPSSPITDVVYTIASECWLEYIVHPSLSLNLKMAASYRYRTAVAVALTFRKTDTMKSISQYEFPMQTWVSYCNGCELGRSTGNYIARSKSMRRMRFYGWNTEVTDWSHASDSIHSVSRYRFLE